MLSLGIDPSMTGFGWCVHDSDQEGPRRVVDRGVLRSPSDSVFVYRYIGLRENVRALLNDFDVRIVGVESVAFGEQWSEGLYALFVYVNEAIFDCAKDVVHFDPGTVKFLTKGDPKRKGKMFKSDMVAKARQDSGVPKWNHNEADAYHIARFAARFQLFAQGDLQLSDLDASEKHVFAREHTFVKGKRAGETERTGMVFRENERFFRFSKMVESK